MIFVFNTVLIAQALRNESNIPLECKTEYNESGYQCNDKVKLSLQ